MSRIDESCSTDGDYGLWTLSDPSGALADIVFVHGLTGNRETTWTHKQTKNFWPQTLLPQDLPNARIFTFGYDADIIGTLEAAGSSTLRDHGKSLANDLALRRMKSRSVGETTFLDYSYSSDQTTNRINVLSYLSRMALEGL